MNNWIFQGNPDVFPIDFYISQHTDIVWSVRQKHFKDLMAIGDTVFLWRSGGKKKEVAGVIALGVLTDTPKLMMDDIASQNLWESGKEVELRVKIRIEKVNLGPKEIVNRDWLKEDPLLSSLLIIKQPQATNYLITPEEAVRLRQLITNTGIPWSREESLAGLWAYTQTYGGSVSRTPDSPVSIVALRIGRAISGVYNKVMNFRALDPRDNRKGFSGGAAVDKEVWNKFYDPTSQTIDQHELEKQYQRIWGGRKETKHHYKDYGEAPNDDPTELQIFAAKVRKGQPLFRKNLLDAYGEKCAITGHGPETVLEAVHIIPHATSGINELDNGLLLRSDLHALFDAGMLTIDPSTLTVRIDEKLKDNEYYKLNGSALRNRVCDPQLNPKYLLIKYS